MLALALILGGGTRSGAWPDAVVELASLPLLVAAIWRLGPELSATRVRLVLLFAAAVAVVPLLQAIPLPAWLTGQFAERAPLAAIDQLAGVEPTSSTLSLVPAATLRSALAMLPAWAVLLGCLTLDRVARRRASLVILGVGLLSVVLDLAQMSGGPGSTLRFYSFTNRDQAVGFFANRNHNAALLYACIPFATAWIAGALFDRRQARRIILVAMVVLYAAALLGIGLTRSRAGLVLCAAAAFASIGLAWSVAGRGRLRAKLLWPLLAANLAGLVLAFQFGFVALAQRLETDSVLADIRWQIAGVSLDAVRESLPFGTGLGTFQEVYAAREQPEMLQEAYVNHAHDDWLELTLEAGVPAVVLMSAFLGWFGWRQFSVWRPSSRSPSTLDAGIARAGGIVAALLLVHSALDYPLRTVALMTLFAFACGTLLPLPAGPEGRAERGGPGRVIPEPARLRHRAPGERPAHGAASVVRGS